jgi:hypothetical protein
MEVLGVVPSDAVTILFGLFCTGNFQFGFAERRQLESIGNFQWADVYKVNLREELIIHLRKGEIRHIPLDQLTFMKRRACQLVTRNGHNKVLGELPIKSNTPFGPGKPGGGPAISTLGHGSL